MSEDSVPTALEKSYDISIIKTKAVGWFRNIIFAYS